MRKRRGQRNLNATISNSVIRNATLFTQLRGQPPLWCYGSYVLDRALPSLQTGDQSTKYSSRVVLTYNPPGSSFAMPYLRWQDCLSEVYVLFPGYAIEV